METATSFNPETVDDDDDDDDDLPEGVTAESLAIAISVVDRVAALPREAYARRRSLRGLRRALTPLVWGVLNRKHYDASKEAARKAHKRTLNREKQRAAAAERAAADRCELRRGRLARLAALQAMNDDAAGGSVSSLMIADGFADELAADDEGKRARDSVDVTSASRACCFRCRQRFGRRASHFFYGDAFCPPCADLNWRKRRQTTTEARGLTCLITGARVKIGFCVALKLLRCGARVVATSRFPGDAIDRYRSLADFATFQDRLEIVGCDFRDLRAVEALAAYVDERFNAEGLDVLINNACQTIRRPAAYSDALQARENELLVSSDEVRLVRRFASATRRGFDDLLDEDDRLVLPPNCFDASGQQLDVRSRNSWTARLADVPVAEAAECLAINALAPLSLCARLKPALLRRPAGAQTAPRFVVNVSAAEGELKLWNTTPEDHGVSQVSSRASKL